MQKSSINHKKYLISVVGPTAIGKTGLTIFLAKHFGSEILSNDSRQFFKEMKIGTAVPTLEELSAVKHHFIQHISIHQTYSVGDFERDSLEFLEQYFSDHDLAFLVGGSGLYERALTEGLDEFPDIDPSIREQLNQEFIDYGLEKLQLELEQKDPVFFTEVDQQNGKRIIRALEIIRGTGKTFSSFRTQKKSKRNFEIIKIGLNLPREELYERINLRVDLMIKEGLIEEARKLYPLRELNALQTVGYRELFDYFDGKITLEEAVEEIKKNTRRFAKRQLTWFNKDKNVSWFLPSDKVEIARFIEEKIIN